MEEQLGLLFRSYQYTIYEDRFGSEFTTLKEIKRSTLNSYFFALTGQVYTQVEKSFLYMK